MNSIRLFAVLAGLGRSETLCDIGTEWAYSDDFEWIVECAVFESSVIDVTACSDYQNSDIADVFSDANCEQCYKQLFINVKRTNAATVCKRGSELDLLAFRCDEELLPARRAFSDCRTDWTLDAAGGDPEEVCDYRLWMEMNQEFPVFADLLSAALIKDPANLGVALSDGLYDIDPALETFVDQGTRAVAP